MELPITWFIVIAFFWTGFFILEGFELLGVGASPALLVGRTDTERRVAIKQHRAVLGRQRGVADRGRGERIRGVLGVVRLDIPQHVHLALTADHPVHDNPGACRSIPRARSPAPDGEATWDWGLTVGSALLPLYSGSGWATCSSGLPINKEGTFTGSFWNLFTAYGIWFGVTLLALTLAHRAMYLSIKPPAWYGPGPSTPAVLSSWLALVALAGFTLWTHAQSSAALLPGALQVITLPAHRPRPGR